MSSVRDCVFELDGKQLYSRDLVPSDRYMFTNKTDPYRSDDVISALEDF